MLYERWMFKTEGYIEGTGTRVWTSRYFDDESKAKREQYFAALMAGDIETNEIIDTTPVERILQTEKEVMATRSDR